VAGVPILINEERSVFAIEDFVRGQDTTFRLQPSKANRILGSLFEMLPSLGHPIGAEKNYEKLAELLLNGTPKPTVLVVGGSIMGRGMDRLARNGSIELVGTDVSFGPLTQIVCDAHDIPFADGTFDAVIVQATLEHVVDPHRCVDEIGRVLKPRGLVYAETPFIQQIHMGAYDFTRFTHSGHRRLFRRFSEVASGPICGPGMALAWSYQYFLLSFVRTRLLRGLVRAFCSLTAFHLKYADHYLMNRKGAIDSASAFYFMGRKEDEILSDRELIRYYRGADSI
jgi:SAM-dependent methyltransferase